MLLLGENTGARRFARRFTQRFVTNLQLSRRSVPLSHQRREAPNNRNQTVGEGGVDNRFNEGGSFGWVSGLDVCWFTICGWGIERIFRPRPC